jgi:hypothetical protein
VAGVSNATGDFDVGSGGNQVIWYQNLNLSLLKGNDIKQKRSNKSTNLELISLRRCTIEWSNCKGRENYWWNQIRQKKFTTLEWPYG